MEMERKFSATVGRPPLRTTTVARNRVVLQIASNAAADRVVHNADDHQRRQLRARSSSPSSPPPSPSPPTKVDGFDKRWNLHVRETATMADFDVYRTVGLGAFGRVLFVKKRTNKRGYAMKAMKKEKIVRLGQAQRVLAEKRILQSIVHPFLVNLRFVFKTNSYLYLVMPFVRGGELFSYMRSFKTFTEEQTKFFSAQVILALQYMHRMRIVYRDLKPENVLIECDGYVKITDLGFAKRIDATTASFVGTPEYMAPEMLVRTRRLQGYAFSVDWWAFGVFVYECAAGMPPFSGASLLQVFDRIVRARYDIPDHFSDGIADLTRRLFATDEKTRIGCGVAGADELRAHPWYAGLDWSALLEKKLPPAFVPNCSADDPTSNFDQYPEEPMEQAARNEYATLFRQF